MKRCTPTKQLQQIELHADIHIVILLSTKTICQIFQSNYMMIFPGLDFFEKQQLANQSFRHSRCFLALLMYIRILFRRKKLVCKWTFH